MAWREESWGLRLFGGAAIAVVLVGAQLVEPSSLAYAESEAAREIRFSTDCFRSEATTVPMQDQRRLDPGPGDGGTGALRREGGATPDAPGRPSDVTMELVGDACDPAIGYLHVAYAGAGPHPPWVRPHDAAAYPLSPAMSSFAGRPGRSSVLAITRPRAHGTQSLVVHYGFGDERAAHAVTWRREVPWRPPEDALHPALSRLAMQCGRASAPVPG